MGFSFHCAGQGIPDSLDGLGLEAEPGLVDDEPGADGHHGIDDFQIVLLQSLPLAVVNRQHILQYGED